MVKSTYDDLPMDSPSAFIAEYNRKRKLEAEYEPTKRKRLRRERKQAEGAKKGESIAAQLIETCATGKIDRSGRVSIYALLASL